MGSNLTFSITTHDPDTGELTNAGDAPVYRASETGFYADEPLYVTLTDALTNYVTLTDALTDTVTRTDV